MIIFALTFVCEIQREQIFDLIILLRVQSEMKIAQECDQEIKRKKVFTVFYKKKTFLKTRKWHARPPPLMANAIKMSIFVLNPSLN